MADEKEQTFKISDKRRYNPDGSLRDGFAEEVSSTPTAIEAEPTPEPQPPTSEAETIPVDNIVAFPGATSKSAGDDQEPMEAPPPAQTKAAAASAAAPQETATKSTQSPQAAAIENAYNQTSGGTDAQQSKALFLSLLNMLAVEAAMHMGLMEMQPGEKTPVDLEAARQVLDILGVLKDKTKGNLLPDEEAIFEQVLADLRMQFVTLMRGK
jgi:hypothetical protein